MRLITNSLTFLTKNLLSEFLFATFKMIFEYKFFVESQTNQIKYKFKTFILFKSFRKRSKRTFVYYRSIKIFFNSMPACKDTYSISFFFFTLRKYCKYFLLQKHVIQIILWLFFIFVV